jgi:hypothetical protein
MKKKPEPKKPKPVYSNSVKRRLAIQQTEKKKIETTHGGHCQCLYCRSGRGFDQYGR